MSHRCSYLIFRVYKLSSRLLFWNMVIRNTLKKRYFKKDISSRTVFAFCDSFCENCNVIAALKNCFYCALRKNNYFDQKYKYVRKSVVGVTILHEEVGKDIALNTAGLFLLFNHSVIYFRNHIGGSYRASKHHFIKQLVWEQSFAQPSTPTRPWNICSCCIQKNAAAQSTLFVVL